MEREGLHFETYVCLQGVTGGCSWKKEARERNTSKVWWLNENGEEKVRVQENRAWDTRNLITDWALFHCRIMNASVNLVKIPFIPLYFEQTLDIFVPRDEFARTKREGNWERVTCNRHRVAWIRAITWTLIVIQFSNNHQPILVSSVR